MPDTMLLIMDMINDLIHPEGRGGAYADQCRARGVYEAVESVIGKARAAAVPIGYVRIGFSPDYRELPPHSPVFRRAQQAGMFKLGAWGAQVYDRFAPEPDDFDIVKHRVSPFYGTALEPILRARGIRRLTLCGVSTNGVVQAAVREGHDRDYAVTLVEDGCSGATEEEHRNALAGLRPFASVQAAAEVSFTP